MMSKPDGESAPLLPAELMACIGNVLNDTATDAEKERLNEMLMRDAEARRAYRRYINLHAALHSRFALSQSRRHEIHPTAPGAKTATVSLAWRMARIAAVLAVVLAGGWLVTIAFRPEGKTALPDATSLAHISKTSGARWGKLREVLAADTRLSAGQVDLWEGMAEITLSNGVRVVLEAPVKFDLQSTEKVSLQSGRLVAYVPPEARGFVIETPHSRVVDLGTEFGVGVDDAGQTEVQVFRGEVVTQVKGAEGKQVDQRLLAGKALSIDATATARGIPFQPQRFVRMFPTENDGNQPGGPVYNRSLHSAVQVVPAPGAVVPDGDLTEWNRSGAFRSACVAPYRESHYVDGMMMYDETHLYIGAHVGDPAPMLSKMDPDADPHQYSWRGGSVIVRLCTDPSAQLPLRVFGPGEKTKQHPEYGTRPEDVNEKIVHLTMWWHQPSAKPRLQLSFGMDFHGELAQPPIGTRDGWMGTFRQDANGLGYTLEYAIPWKLLNAGARPLRAGDELAANWTVHWSDEKGELSRGHLVEITNPAVQPFRFLRGESWGKAIFQKKDPSQNPAAGVPVQ